MTYSIVARDHATGAMGVAVQSRAFSAGSVVPAASPGVGAVATQSVPNLRFKARGLTLLRDGNRAPEVVAALAAEDEQLAFRQFAVIDAHGGAAAFTGAHCIPEAGHVIGDGYSCQANLMRNPGVPEAMAEAYEAMRGRGLTRALLAALDAAEAAGGDLRGRQSAGILIVPADGHDGDPLLDLRVEDSPEPLQELARLVALHDVYAMGEDADALLERGDLAGATARLLALHEAAGDPEIALFVGIELIRAGEPDRGTALVREATERDDRWLELLRRLPAELSPSAADALHLLGHDTP